MKNIKLAEKILVNLNEFYPPGLYEWLYKFNNKLYDKIIQVENDLHKIISGGSEEQTKELLSIYWILHKKAIDEFINSEEILDYELDYTAIRKEMLEERISV